MQDIEELLRREHSNHPAERACGGDLISDGYGPMNGGQFLSKNLGTQENPFYVVYERINVDGMPLYDRLGDEFIDDIAESVINKE